MIALLLRAYDSTLVHIEVGELDCASIGLHLPVLELTEVGGLVCEDDPAHSVELIFLVEPQVALAV